MRDGNRDLLDSLRIASPCKADWTRMSGDERQRFCAECKLHVHDLSAMNRDEALRLITQGSTSGKRVCVRFHRRADGRVMTRDCPKGLRRRLRWAWARAAALFTALASLGCTRSESTGPGVKGEPILLTPPEPRLLGEVIMGDMVQPSPEVMGRVAVPSPGENVPTMGTPAPVENAPPAGTPQPPRQGPR